MPEYSYRGIGNDGRRVSGRLIAEDERAVLIRLKADGIHPGHIAPASGERGMGSALHRGTPGGGRVGSGDLTVFSRQLANLVRGGLPLMRTFAALTEHTENPRLKTALVRMQQDINSGKALWEALEQYPGIFPRLYVSMVKAGEASGQLHSTLQWLAEYLEKDQARKTQIRGALAYPILLVSIGTLSVALLITLVVPKFAAVFEEFEQALPAPTVALLSVSGFISQWWWAVAVCAVITVLSVKAYARTPQGRFKLDALKMKMPIFGKLGLKAAVSRFARTTATLLQGGISLFDSISIARDVVDNEVLARAADTAREGMREGESFAGQLRETGVFPSLLTNMAAVGEETGDLQSVLLTVADAYDVEVEATLKSVVSLLEPVIIVTVGSVIGFVILAMLLPIFQINLMGG
ncbi:MAG: type II secretion system F family protein [bacterium]|nr:type II secretion system F family protein [bacterium]